MASAVGKTQSSEASTGTGNQATTSGHGGNRQRHQQ